MSIQKHPKLSMYVSMQSSVKYCSSIREVAIGGIILPAFTWLVWQAGKYQQQLRYFTAFLCRLFILFNPKFVYVLE